MGPLKRVLGLNEVKSEGTGSILIRRGRGPEISGLLGAFRRGSARRQLSASQKESPR
jgi:hypothetical protein